MKERSKVVAASSVGTFLDFYVFILAATASGTVWVPLFFKNLSSVPTVAFALSILAYGVAYLVRPLGNLIFGHMGDRSGRKKTMISTLIVIFISTIGLGLIPSFATIGVLAPILVYVFRIMQGIGFGGEWGGAASWIMEFTPNKSRGLMGGILQSSAFWGISLVLISFGVMSALTTGAFFLAYGWRILFYIGGATAVLGAVMRYRVAESPLFKKLEEEKKVDHRPSVNLWKTHWKQILTLALAYLWVTAVTSVVLVPYSLKIFAGSHSSNVFGISSVSFFLIFAGIGAITTIFSSILVGALSDRYGRTKVYLVGSIIFAFMIYVYFGLFNTLNTLDFIAAVIILEFAQGLGSGVVGSWFPETFPTKFRYSGAGYCFQFAGFFNGIGTGLILPALIVLSPTIQGAWIYVSYLMVAETIIGIVFTLVYHFKFSAVKEDIIAPEAVA